MKQDKLQEVQDEYNSKSQGINELTNVLSQVSDELGGIKGRMDERGQNMTDTSPLIKIKSALQRIKEERKSMDGTRARRRRFKCRRDAYRYRRIDGLLPLFVVTLLSSDESWGHSCALGT